MLKARRLGHATFTTPDLQKTIDYYTGVIGLNLIARAPQSAFLATPLGQLAIRLEQGDAAQCSGLAFEVAPGLDPAEIARRLAEDGVSTDLRSDAAPGMAKSVAFRDPKGTEVQLFPAWEFVAGEERPAGIAPLKFGHLAFVVPDPRTMANFYERVLGFREADWIEDFFVFMRCNADHHTVNFIRGDRVRLHHMAFELKDFAHMQNACEWLGQRRIAIDWGPVRLGPGHNVGVFHRNADGQMTELYIELDQMKDEELGYFDPRPWHRDRPQRPKVWPADQSTIWGPGPPAVMRPSA